jgi:hypothetical protein
MPRLTGSPQTDRDWNLLTEPSSRAIAVDGTNTTQQGP